MAGTRRGEDRPTPSSDCVAFCQQYQPATTEANALWGCLAQHADCPSYTACYFNACLVSSEPPVSCMPLGPTCSRVRLCNVVVVGGPQLSVESRGPHTVEVAGSNPASPTRKVEVIEAG
jgi:hypothetical protein